MDEKQGQIAKTRQEILANLGAARDSLGKALVLFNENSMWRQNAKEIKTWIDAIDELMTRVPVPTPEIRG